MTNEIETFVAALQAKVGAYYAEHYPASAGVCFEVQQGVKRVRIVKKDNPTDQHGSAYCFIDTATGDIFKPDGFKRPAKHARGNIRSADPLACCGPHGVAYLR